MYDNASDGATAMPEVLTDFEPATPEEVRSFIQKAPNKSCELDPIPIWLLTQYLDELTHPVTVMNTRSMETGSVLMCFISARIRPLLKKSV